MGGYTHYIDETSGHEYYVHDTSGESTWAVDMVEGGGGGDDDEATATAAAASAEAVTSDPQASLGSQGHSDDAGTPSSRYPGWTEYYDAAQQHAYFVNDTTHESKWAEEMSVGEEEGVYDGAA